MSCKNLLPCPFCGGEAVLIEPNEHWSCYHVHCVNECCIGWKSIEASFLVADKAIAAWNTRATRGTLTTEQVREVVYRNSTYNDIYKVHQVSRTDMQAIADELNAELGCGACEVESEFWHDHGGYDRDTYEFVLSCGHSVEWMDSEPPKHCPHCGARVEAVKR